MAGKMIMAATKVRPVLSPPQPWRARAWRSAGDRPAVHPRYPTLEARVVSASLPSRATAAAV
eukprot:7382709-Prymnesium_polylepis.1